MLPVKELLIDHSATGRQYIHSPLHCRTLASAPFLVCRTFVGRPRSLVFQAEHIHTSCMSTSIHCVSTFIHFVSTGNFLCLRGCFRFYFEEGGNFSYSCSTFAKRGRKNRSLKDESPAWGSNWKGFRRMFADTQLLSWKSKSKTCDVSPVKGYLEVLFLL